MGWLWNLLRVRSAFDLAVAAPVADVVRQMRSAVQSARPPVLSGREGYAGEVTDQGFAIRRFGRTLSRGESRPAVDVRGDFRPDGGQTRVTVVTRHGRLLVTFAWLLLLVGLTALAGPAGGGHRGPGQPSSACGAFVIAAFGILFYLALWWDMWRVRREVIALVTDAAAGGPPNQSLRPTGGA